MKHQMKTGARVIAPNNNGKHEQGTLTVTEYWNAVRNKKYKYQVDFFISGESREFDSPDLIMRI